MVLVDIPIAKWLIATTYNWRRITLYDEALNSSVHADSMVDSLSHHQWLALGDLPSIVSGRSTAGSSINLSPILNHFNEQCLFIIAI